MELQRCLALAATVLKTKTGSFKVGGCSNLKLNEKPATAARKGPFDKPASKTVKAWCQGGANRVKEKKIDMKEEKIDVTEVERASTLDMEIKCRPCQLRLTHFTSPADMQVQMKCVGEGPLCGVTACLVESKLCFVK